MNSKLLMSGNEAIAEAATRAGCSAYFGYPITPQNEFTAYMSWRIPEAGGAFIQAESELAAINMVFGASVAGKRAMTSSSSPGVSLKQEGISYLAGCELPAVILNVMRGGPGLGNIGPAQSDYFQATRGGGHGDYRTPVLAPYSVSEAVELTFLAFDLADKYRNPVMILIDGVLGQMMEPFQPAWKDRKVKSYEKKWALTGCNGRKPQRICSLILKAGGLEEHNYKLQEKYKNIEKKETRSESFMAEDAEIIVVAYGISARLCKSAVVECRKKGIKTGLIRPITLWPFPHEIIDNSLKGTVKNVLVVEMSLGQMIDDVKIAVNGKVPVSFYGRPGGVFLEVDDIIEAIKNSL